HRARGDANASFALLRTHPGELSHTKGDSRHGVLSEARRHFGPTVLESRPGVVPQRPYLSAPGGAGAAAATLPCFATTRRCPLFGPLRMDGTLGLARSIGALHSSRP